jgi:hypothetical protein
MLVHHADAGGHRLARIPQLQDLITKPDRALVRREQPEEHVHEGGLARPILTEKTVDATRDDVDTDVVVGGEGAETFRDT